MDAMATVAWSDALEQEVIRRWLAKESAKRISEALLAKGLHVTRNAIMGKVNRLGLQRAKVTVLPPMPRAPTPYRAHVAPRKPKAPAQQRPEKKIVPTVIEIFPLMVAFGDLDHGQCRFECSDAAEPADYQFCGLPVRDTECSYCSHHAALCLRAAEARPGRSPFPRAA
jgi:hypothetical protein